MSLSLVIIIANSGFVDDIMDSIKIVGAKGGTILSGNGTVSENAQKLYGVGIHPEKDCLLTIVDQEIKDKVLKTVYDLNIVKQMGAIAFSLPISDASTNLINQYENKEFEEDKS